SKLLITLLILGLIVALGYFLLNKTEFGQNLKQQADEAVGEASSNKNDKTNSSSSNDKNTSSSSNNGSQAAGGTASVDKDGNKVLRVQLVSWGGYGPGLYFNEGAAANARSRFFQEYGFKVDFKLENDLFNALDAWIAGEYDVLVQTADAFPLYTAPKEINDFRPKAFMQVDWSRGGDAIIVKDGINSINDLKGKKVAVTVPSPSQTLLITALEAAGLKYSDVNVIKTSDNFKAAELFQTKDVDAAVVWSPDDIMATRAVPRSKVLLNTEQQSHIVADIMFAKESFINGNKDMIDKFYEGWMKGAAEINGNAGNRSKAVKYLAEFNGIPEADADGMASTVYWTSHGDNVNFFGLNPSFKGQTGKDLYSKMSRKFVESGDAENEAPGWRGVIYTGAIQKAQSSLNGPKYAPEGFKEFKPVTVKEKTVTPIATKPVSISFASGQHLLDNNAKTLIDLQIKDDAKGFGNLKIRIEGNTDNVGAKQMNMELSRKRAESVAKYLESEYGMDRNRFIIKGNGPDNPVQGCEQNQNETCKAKNRRTEFQLIPAG
ncbi:MAG: phosphate ABC transporter substrate-binding/OmpA family protein, partial [Bacteroidota bacterium]